MRPKDKKPLRGTTLRLESHRTLAGLKRRLVLSIATNIYWYGIWFETSNKFQVLRGLNLYKDICFFLVSSSCQCYLLNKIKSIKRKRKQIYMVQVEYETCCWLCFELPRYQRQSFEGMLKFKLGLGAYVVVVDHQIMGAACSVTVIEMLMSTIHA